MTTTTAALTAATVADLRATREQWGDLLAAVEQPPAQVWPPRETRAFLNQGAADAEDTARPAVGRLPLVLREHPAPLNLDALDAACAIEADLFDLADLIASSVQRPGDTANPERWILPSARDALMPRAARGMLTATDPRTPGDRAAEEKHGAPRRHGRQATAGSSFTVASAGSRVYGLHWCSVWVEGRLLGEDVDNGAFRPVGGRQLDEAHAVASRAHARLTRALNRDTRTMKLAAACPWCGSQLIGRNTGGDPTAAVVWCTGGRGCGAHAELDAQGRRTWQGAALTGLYGALAGKVRRTARA